MTNAISAVAETVRRLGIKAHAESNDGKFGRIHLKSGSKYTILVNPRFGVTLHRIGSNPVRYTPWTMDYNQFVLDLIEARILKLQ